MVVGPVREASRPEPEGPGGPRGGPRREGRAARARQREVLHRAALRRLSRSAGPASGSRRWRAAGAHRRRLALPGASGAGGGFRRTAEDSATCSWGRIAVMRPGPVSVLPAACLSILVASTATAQASGPDGGAPPASAEDNFDTVWVTASSDHFLIYASGGARNCPSPPGDRPRPGRSISTTR